MQMLPTQKQSFLTYRTHNLLSQNYPIYTRMTQGASTHEKCDITASPEVTGSGHQSRSFMLVYFSLPTFLVDVSAIGRSKTNTKRT